jgi:anti-sigma regulatory factor (Ser/Thr protein kinase)
MAGRPEGFRHEALLHAGGEEFLEAAVPFVQEGLEAGERIMLALTPPKLELLRRELSAAEAARVAFVDMHALGANPGRIIPAWRDFLAAEGCHGDPARGIGEPVWPGRSPAELVECHRHEALLNLAFAAAPAFSLMCPYDTEALAAEVIEEAQRNHPVLREGAVERPSSCCRDLAAVAAPFAKPLPNPPAEAVAVPFDVGTLSAVRRLVETRARAEGLRPPHSEDLVLAVNEVVTNSVRHGGGSGTLSAWSESGSLVFEVRDEGHIEHALAGRRRPAAGEPGGYGLWLANQVCDLVQLRTFPGGNVVRLHMRRASGLATRPSSP